MTTFRRLKELLPGNSGDLIVSIDEQVKAWKRGRKKVFHIKRRLWCNEAIFKCTLYEQNLLSEYRIRHGGYGGIGYYYVSDIVHSSFQQLHPVRRLRRDTHPRRSNQERIQHPTPYPACRHRSPKHAGMCVSYLLSISLIPRIRGLKKLNFFRPHKKSRYEHIDSLFNESINWKLIETHLQNTL
jgi:hypothetical protein